MPSFRRSSESVADLSPTPGKVDGSSRRSGRTWIAAEQVGQPQDGAESRRQAGTNGQVVSPVSGPASQEPEDANLTGGKRSLMRRLLGLNVILPHQAGKTVAAPELQVKSWKA